jgi:hypothetical protein
MSVNTQKQAEFQFQLDRLATSALLVLDAFASLGTLCEMLVSWAMVSRITLPSGSVI